MFDPNVEVGLHLFCQFAIIISLWVMLCKPRVVFPQSEPDFDLDIKEDVQEESSKYGKLKHIYVDK